MRTSILADHYRELDRIFEALVVKASTDVAVVARDQASCVQTTADLNDVGTNLFIGSRAHLSVLPHLFMGPVLVAAFGRAEVIGSVGQR